MKSIKVFSWNILGPETKDVPWFSNRYPAIIDWHYRFDVIIKKILEATPDIICLQEIGENQKHAFESVLYQHDFYLGSYQSKGPHGGAIIFYKKDRFKLNNLGHIKLNPHQKFHHDSACAWVTLIDTLNNNQSFFISSVHLQPQYILEQITDFFEAIKTLSRTIPIVVIGDFNTKYATMINTVMPYLEKIDISTYAIKLFYHESWTHQATIQHDNKEGYSSLDHALYTNNMVIDIKHSFAGNKEQSYKTDLASIAVRTVVDASMKPFPNENNPSDHLPLLVTLFFT